MSYKIRRKGSLSFFTPTAQEADFADIITAGIASGSFDGTLVTRLEALIDGILPVPPPPDTGTVFGTYKGYLRLDPSADAGTTAIRFAGARITGHPNAGKLFFCSTNGVSSGGGIWELTLPNLATLETDPGNLATSDKAVLSNLVPIHVDWQAAVAAQNGPTPNYTRIGGIGYEPSSGELWVNFAKYYDVGTSQFPHLARFSTDGLFSKLTNYLVSSPTYSASGGGENSDPYGPLAPTEGTSLASYSKFLTTAYWLSNSYGPRVFSLGAVDADYYAWQRLIQHSPADQPAPPTVLYSTGGGFFTSTHYCVPIRKGTLGWYGNPDGYSDAQSDPGTLTGRTDADTGVVTRSSGSKVSDGDLVRVSWGDDGASNRRDGMTAAVSGNAITVDGGSGADLPALSTAVKVWKYLADASNVVPDPWSSSKGYHAPPHTPYLYKILLSELVERAQGARQQWDFTYEVEDMSSFLIGTVTGGYKRGSVSSVIKHEGNIFVMETTADTSQSAFNTYPIIHVFDDPES